MSTTNLFQFNEGEIWGIQLPSPKGMQSIRVRIVGQNQFGVGFIDDVDEADGIQFLSGAVPFMARRLMTVEEAKAEDARRDKLARERLEAVGSEMEKVEKTTRIVIP